MKVPKIKCKVCVFCIDGSFAKGYVYIDEGFRLIDYLNAMKGDFLVMTEAEFQNVKEVHSFQLLNFLTKKRATIFLNKQSIKWIEEN